MHTHLAYVLEKYARMELEEIRLLKAGALPEGSSGQRTAFLTSINKDYEALAKTKKKKKIIKKTRLKIHLRSVRFWGSMVGS